MSAYPLNLDEYAADEVRPCPRCGLRCPEVEETATRARLACPDCGWSAAWADCVLRAIWAWNAGDAS